MTEATWKAILDHYNKYRYLTEVEEAVLVYEYGRLRRYIDELGDQLGDDRGSFLGRDVTRPVIRPLDTVGY